LPASLTFVAQAMATTQKTYVEKRSWCHTLMSFHRVFEWHAVTYTLLMMYGFSQVSE